MKCLPSTDLMFKINAVQYRVCTFGGVCRPVNDSYPQTCPRLSPSALTLTLFIVFTDMLQQEPAWSDGETCLQCSTKFSLATRKHHCRHCGRLLCSKCSERDMPIIKYNITKPVRVCEICFDVLTLGTSGM